MVDRFGQADPSLVVEEFDSRLCRAREIAQRGHQRFKKTGVGFINRYERGEINIGLWCPFRQQSENGFVIHAKGTEWSWQGNKISTGTPVNYRGAAQPGLHSEQAPVLAYDVEVMENPKRIVPSLVRLQRFDNRLFGRGQSLYEFIPFVVASAKGIDAACDGEISVVGVRYAVAVSERCSQNIETAPYGVEVGANLDLCRDGQWFPFENYEDVIRGVRTCIFESHIEISIDPAIGPFFEGWKIGHGPVDCGLRV